MTEEKCPCCGRHCSLDDLHCDRGREYVKTGVIPERKDDHKKDENKKHVSKEEYDALSVEDRIIFNLSNVGRALSHHGENIKDNVLNGLDDNERASLLALLEKMAQNSPHKH